MATTTAERQKKYREKMGEIKRELENAHRNMRMILMMCDMPADDPKNSPYLVDAVLKRIKEYAGEKHNNFKLLEE